MSGLIQSSKNKKDNKDKQQTRGLVKNTPIEFTTTTSIDDLKITEPVKANKINNQRVTIKIPKTLKMDIEALTNVTEYKYAYEVLDAAIQYYVENKLNSDQKKVFKLIQQHK